MRVIPRRAILRGIEAVHEIVVGRNGTLCNPVDAVHVHGEPLADAMPMDAGTVMGKLVGNVHFDQISPAGLDPRAGVMGSVDIAKHLGIREVQSVCHDPVLSNREVVPAYRSHWHQSFTFGRCFVVFGDIPRDTFVVGEPAAAVLGSGALPEAGHARIVTFELGAIPIVKATRWFEDRPGTFLMMRAIGNS